MKKKDLGDTSFLDHPGINKDLPEGEKKMCNDDAMHLHHPQIPAARGHVEPQFNPKKGFPKKSGELLGQKPGK